MTTDFPDAQTPGSRVGPITLTRPIAQGGEGIVYIARHDTLGDVVVKEFWPKQIVSRMHSVSARAAQDNWQPAYRDGVKQFLWLGRRLIELPRHAGIMVALDVFEANNTAYLVTEQIAGRTLDAALDAGAFSDPAEIRQLADRLSDAMAHLHAQGLFHRDLAPDNIIITAGLDWHPVLIDFNAAKDIVQKVSRSLDGIVKPGYTAIEQYSVDAKEPIGAWTDIYSASAVLYRCITGQAPADPAVRLLRPGQSARLSDSFADRFDPAFLAGIDAGLEPHPDKRPKSVAEWRAAMGLVRTGPEPDHSAPPPAAEPPSSPEPAPPPTESAAMAQPEETARPATWRKWLVAAGVPAIGLILALSLYRPGQPGTEPPAPVVTPTAADTLQPAVPTGAPAGQPTGEPVGQPTGEPTGKPVAPLPIKPIASLVNTRDYPLSAIAVRQEGTARFELTVAPDGKVSACKITASSGSQALDLATCGVIRPRARFNPARDPSGKPTIGTFSGELRWKLPKAAAAICNRGPFIIHFAFDQDAISPDAKVTLDAVAANWRACNGGRVIVNGYAGDASSPAYAVGFSQRRATRVAEYLTSKGVNRNSILSQGMGKADTGGSGPDSRRVEITIF